MIYLYKGFFQPTFILISVALLPINIGLWILSFSPFRIEILITSIVFSFFYIISILGIKKLSSSKKNYLYSEGSNIVIKHANSSPNSINRSDILHIEYYKLLSIRGWLLLISNICPQSAFITYLYEGKNVCHHVGYPNFNELRKLCDDLEIKLVIK